MKRLFFPLVCLSTLLTCFYGCQEADTTAPNIIVSQPAQNDTIEAGEELCIQVTFTDDVALSSYKINIHPNFNGHKHAPRKMSQQSESKTEDLDLTLTSQLLNDTLTGRNCFRDIDIDIPHNVTRGAYHLLIYCTDLAGNEAYVAQDLNIE